MVAHVAFILLFTSSDMLFTKSKLAVWLELPQLLGMPCTVSDHRAILKKTHVLSVFAKTLFAHPISHGSVLITNFRCLELHLVTNLLIFVWPTGHLGTNKLYNYCFMHLLEPPLENVRASQIKILEFKYRAPLFLLLCLAVCCS